MSVTSFGLSHSFSSESLPGAGGSQVVSTDITNPLGSVPPPEPGPNLTYVVENDRISSAITTLIVQKNLLGGEVQRYINGQQAFDTLTLAQQQGYSLPDLIVLDLDMPLMDGWQFLDALVELVPTSPIRVFVLTSSLSPEDQAKALTYKQVKGFFTKPLKEVGVARMQALLRAAPGTAA